MIMFLSLLSPQRFFWTALDTQSFYKRLISGRQYYFR